MDYLVDHFLNRFFGPFFLPFWEGKHTDTTKGGMGCSLSVLREGWEAECY